MGRNRVVITGLGVVAPNGIGVEAFWQANVDGRSGVRAVDSFDVSDLGSRIAGQVRNFDPFAYMSTQTAKRTDRFVHLGVAAAKMAVEDSGLNLAEQDRSRIGVIVGSGLGGVLFHEEQILHGYDRGAHRLNPLCVPRITPNAVASHIGIEFGLHGPSFVIAAACASGSIAVGEAFRKIQTGEADAFLCGGAEAPLTRFTFGSYCALGALSRKRNDEPERASRPFDRDRDGFVIAEGAAMLLLERLDRAVQRSARIIAEIGGYAALSGAHHMVMPQADGVDAAEAMRSAILDADLAPSDVGYINAHGTATMLNDSAETLAIKEVFGPHAYALPVSSTKSMIGHAIGAAGAIEALVCALVLHRGVIPPTINYENEDPDCDLDYVPNKSREASARVVLSNSFGFGSCNSCLVFKKWSPS